MALRSSKDAVQSSALQEDSPGDKENAAEVPSGQKEVGRWQLRALVFIGGVSSLSLEMCAPRLLGPYFGTSLFVWANIIGFFLLYLALGYFIGGRIADRYPDYRLLAGITTIAALFTALIPLISPPILNWSVQGLENVEAGVFYSSMVTVILLFAVPVTFLGMVSPFAVRLSVIQVGSSGKSAGNLYALSTAGSILGAFIPVLVLIPYLGVRRTLLATSACLLFASLWGLDSWIRLPLMMRVRARWPSTFLGLLILVPVLLPQLAPLGPLKTIPGMIYSKESLYNYIQVVREPDGTMELVLNEGDAIHSVYNPHQILTGWYWDYFLAAPYFNSGASAGKVHRLAIIGLAAGTIARQFTAVYGNIPIDGVEIDPDIVAAGRKYFAMTEPNLSVYIADGRTFIRVTKHTYDVVAVDAYQQPYIPFELTTKEFFQEVRDHLSANGVLCLNTGHTGNDYRLVHAFVNTLYTVFPSVYTFDVPGTFNTEIMATVRPTTLATFQSNLEQVSPDSLMGTVADEVLPEAKVARAQPGGLVFTDDQAPIEEITDQLILNYIQQGH
ncbi:MAG: spermidine synthase [Ktedonobacterales bacterium]